MVPPLIARNGISWSHKCLSTQAFVLYSSIISRAASLPTDSAFLPMSPMDEVPRNMSLFVHKVIPVPVEKESLYVLSMDILPKRFEFWSMFFADSVCLDATALFSRFEDAMLKPRIFSFSLKEVNMAFCGLGGCICRHTRLHPFG